MIIDVTAQLAPVGAAIFVALVLSGLGIVSCVDRQEVSAAGRWVRTTRDALVTSLRSLLNAGRLQPLNRS